MAAHLPDAEEPEDDAPERYKQVVTIRLTPTQVAAFRRAAKHLGVGVGTLMRMKLLEHFDWQYWARPAAPGGVPREKKP